MKIYKIIIIFCIINGCGLDRESCDFDFFEKASGIEFPLKIEIIDCFDSGEYFIWTRLKFQPEDACEFIQKSKKFEKYNEPQPNEKSWLLFQDQTIELVEKYISEKYRPIHRTQNTYIFEYCNGNQWIIYIINTETGDFWGLIQYPDWSGDKPC